MAEGYARNFLISRNLAVPPPVAPIERGSTTSPAAKRSASASARPRSPAQRISSTTLTMGVKVGEGGKLYGSITAKDIAEALARRGIEVDVATRWTSRNPSSSSAPTRWRCTCRRGCRPR